MTAHGTPIELPAADVYALAAALTAAAEEADTAAFRLAISPGVGGALQPAIEEFLAGQRAAGRAFAGELRWLGSTVAGVADSWLELDARLLGGRARTRAR